MTSHPRAWDDYFIPGTFVLRNTFIGPGEPYGITDGAELNRREEQRTALRLAELAVRPVEGGFDYDHMKAIHRHVFQDVYDWAGEERTAPTDRFMTKDGHSYYPAGPSLANAAEAEYAKIADSGYLRGLPHDAFVTELSERWGELNVVHSFREGNTRTQFVFFSQLCDQAGYALDARQFAVGRPLRDEFVLARFEGQDTGSNARLAAVLAQAVTKRGPTLSRAEQAIAERIERRRPRAGGDGLGRNQGRTR